MGKVVVSSFVSLDGRVDDPDGQEGHPAGGWVGRVAERPLLAQALAQEAFGAAGLLLGRRTYDFLARRWTPRDGRLANRLNNLPKTLVASRPAEQPWGPTTRVDDVVPVCDELRAGPGEHVVYGSATLVATLLQHGLVDELRLTVVPVALGQGRRLLDAPTPSRWRLESVGALDDGFVQLIHRVTLD